MIFARLNTNPEQHRILFTDDYESEKFKFYSIPTVNEQTKFNPEKILQKNEWYYVKLGADQIIAMIDPYKNNEISTGDENNAKSTEYSIIDVVYRVVENAIIFTKITDSFKINNRKIVKLYDTREAQLIEEEQSILFTGNKDAYFDGVDKLYFKKFSTIRSMFSGIEVFFREATQQEKQTFLDNELFDVGDINPDDIGPRDSARIAAVLNDPLIEFTNGTNAFKILQAARIFEEAKIEISEDNKIMITNTKELKKALNLITSRYYVSSITGQKMESYGSATLESN